MKLSCIVIFICFNFIGCGQQVDQGETVVVEDGVEVPIKPCIEANTQILGNSVDPVAFCKCLVPKFYADLKDDDEKRKLLQEGNWYELSKDQQESMVKYYESCMTASATNDSTAKFSISPRMADGIKKKMKMDLLGSEIESTNDIDKYCDCIIKSLRTDFTVNEILQDNFNETEKYTRVVGRCLSSTRIAPQ